MLAGIDHIDKVVKRFIATNCRALVIPAISGRVALHEMLTSQATPALRPLKHKLSGIRIIVSAIKFHHFANVGFKAGTVANATTLVQVVKDDNGATILIGNVTQFIDAITSIRADEINVHAS